MSKSMRIFFAVMVVLLVSATNIFAITKVAARYNVMEFNVSSATAHGSYNRIGIGGYKVPFFNEFGQLLELDAEVVYDNSVAIGLNYGRLINDNVLFNVGFSFTDVQIGDSLKSFFVNIPTHQIHWMKLRMYNIDFNWNYYIYSPVKKAFAPYGGVGFQAGLLSASGADFASESDFIMATSFNFGADLKVWKTADEMGFLSISSVNSYQFYASESRPKYLTIGLGLKYFMRP